MWPGWRKCGCVYVYVNSWTSWSKTWISDSRQECTQPANWENVEGCLSGCTWRLSWSVLSPWVWIPTVIFTCSAFIMYSSPASTLTWKLGRLHGSNIQWGLSIIWILNSCGWQALTALQVLPHALLVRYLTIWQRWGGNTITNICQISCIIIEVLVYHVYGVGVVWMLMICLLCCTEWCGGLWHRLGGTSAFWGLG